VLIVGVAIMLGGAFLFLASFDEERESRQVLYAIYGIGAFITACVYVMFATFLQIVVSHLDWRVETYYDDEDLAELEDE
jgi:uncharacterized membrane protein HdeD (DUF308 family)